jgi:hypothetical protein
LILTVLQIVRLPNIKVSTVLLSCAFFYDIFWVFVSPLIFQESVMIVVCSMTGAVVTLYFLSAAVMSIKVSVTKTSDWIQILVS